jgi:hypothetical protein
MEVIKVLSGVMNIRDFRSVFTQAFSHHGMMGGIRINLKVQHDNLIYSLSLYLHCSVKYVVLVPVEWPA